jgi:hypothetical protein
MRRIVSLSEQSSCSGGTAKFWNELNSLDCTRFRVGLSSKDVGFIDPPLGLLSQIPYFRSLPSLDSGV